MVNQEWVPTERDNRLHDLATRYHNSTEAFDRTVCTGPIRDGSIMPATYRELVLSNQNALAVRKRFEEEAAKHGISREELSLAICNWHNESRTVRTIRYG